MSKQVSILSFFGVLMIGCAGYQKIEPEIIGHPPLQFEYSLVSMIGHEEALVGDRAVLGAELKKTKLCALQYWGGKVELSNIVIGGCVKYHKTPDGWSEALHRCTEIVTIEGQEIEYLPYANAGSNFLESIAPAIAEVKYLNKQIIWLDADGLEIARFGNESRIPN